MRKLFYILVCIVAVLQLGSFISLNLGGGTSAVPREQGLQTNIEELTRFHDLWVNEGGTGPVTTDRGLLATDAGAAKDSWAYSIDAGDWEWDYIPEPTCIPVGALGLGPEYDLDGAASDILAMALYGALLDINSPGTGDAYFSAVKTRILEFTNITGFGGIFEVPEVMLQNGCIFAISSAIPQILEAAWLIEEAGYTETNEWESSDRQTLAFWAVNVVFPLASFDARQRKEYQGITGLGATMAIAAYSVGIQNTGIVETWDGYRTTPNNWLLQPSTDHLLEWLDNSTGQAKGIRNSACFQQNRTFGLQSNGRFPDETRQVEQNTFGMPPYGGFIDDSGRTPFPSNNVASCDYGSLGAVAGDPLEDPNGTCSTLSGQITSGCLSHVQFQQLATNSFARTCEIFRRLDKGGGRCFDLDVHNPGGGTTALNSAILFSTTELLAAGDVRYRTFGPYQDFWTHDELQGYIHVASTYYDNYCSYIALTDGDVPLQGGDMYPYTRITHRDGVAHVGPLSAGSTWDCATWDNTLWSN